MSAIPRIGSFLSEQSEQELGKASINDPLAKVLAIMSEKKYSQIVIFDGKDGLAGVVSWQSIAKRFLHASPNNMTVSDCMEEAQVIPEDASIVEASNIIANHDYVVVMEKNRTGVKGIVTASDFMEATKSFILIGAIEEKIRLIIERIGTKKPIEQTFGNYLIFFKYLKSGVDAGLISDEFIERLSGITGIRNCVMHFDEGWYRKDNRQELEDFFTDLEKILKNIEDNFHKTQLSNTPTS